MRLNKVNTINSTNPIVLNLKQPLTYTPSNLSPYPKTPSIYDNDLKITLPWQAYNSDISFGRVSNNPADMDPIEADTQSNFFLSRIDHEFVCPDCGRPIMTKPIIERINNEVKNADEKTYLDVVENNSRFLLPIEEEVFNILKEGKKKFPDKTISHIANIERKKRKIRCEQEQLKVLNELKNFAKTLSPKDRTAMMKIIGENSMLIQERDDSYYFKRKTFMNALYTMNLDNAQSKKDAIDIANKLPSPLVSVDSWFIKYAGWDKKNKDFVKSEDIISHLFNSAYTQTDHIHSHKNGGLDAVSNFWLLHARCNQVKNDKDFVTWLAQDKEHRVENIRTYLQEAQKVLEKEQDPKIKLKYGDYAAKIADTLYKESNGELDLRAEFPHIKLEEEIATNC